MFCCANKRLLLLIALAVAAFLGLAYVLQWQAILAYAPFLLVLLCPLMHLFMTHGDHDGKSKNHPPSPHGKKKDYPSCH